jgi:hypothetical protein
MVVSCAPYGPCFQKLRRETYSARRFGRLARVCRRVCGVYYAEVIDFRGVGVHRHVSRGAARLSFIGARLSFIGARMAFITARCSLIGAQLNVRFPLLTRRLGAGSACRLGLFMISPRLSSGFVVLEALGESSISRCGTRERNGRARAGLADGVPQG